MVFIREFVLGGPVVRHQARNLYLVLIAVLALTGCNSTDPTLGVTPADASKQTALPSIQPTTPADAAKASARLYIAPIIGSTVAAVTPLSRRLSAQAKANDLAIVADADPAKTYVVKGYFSALPENGSTTIVFVWDVFDPSGVRQHRIQGQEIVPGTAADPWSIVPPATMEKIADRTIADFKAWQGGAVAAAAVPAVVAPVVPPVAAPVPPVAPQVAPAVTPTPVKPAVIPTVPAPPPSIKN
jgi:hypothetical protein